MCVGSDDGANCGASEGTGDAIDGDEDNSRLGCAVGVPDGERVRLEVGWMLGLKVGTSVGANDGPALGVDDCVEDGSEDTSRLDGFEVGVADGSGSTQPVQVLGQSCQRFWSAHLAIVRSGSLPAQLHQGLFFLPINHASLLSVQMLGALEGGTEGSRVGGSDCPSDGGTTEGSMVGSSDSTNDGNADGVVGCLVGGPD